MKKTVRFGLLATLVAAMFCVLNPILIPFAQAADAAEGEVGNNAPVVSQDGSQSRRNRLWFGLGPTLVGTSAVSIYSTSYPGSIYGALGTR